jgi:hypothetical protein
LTLVGMAADATPTTVARAKAETNNSFNCMASIRNIYLEVIGLRFYGNNLENQAGFKEIIEDFYIQLLRRRVRVWLYIRW